MALTKRNAILRRYRDQEDEEKRLYKEERGLKNAVGFKQSEGYQRIQKNKRNALYRDRAKKQNEQTAKLPGLLAPSNEPIPKQSGEVEIGGQTVKFDAQTIFDGDMFWTALSNNQGFADIKQNGIIDQFEAEHEIDPSTKAVISFVDGTRETYRTPLQLERGLLKLMRQAAEAQKESGDSAGNPISASRIEVGNQVIYYIYADE